MKKSLAAVICCTIIVQIIHAQNVGIGTNSPHASAQLDITSTSKGMLVPRMTSAQRIAIASPATGLLVYDTDTNSFWFWRGTVWQIIPSVATAWSLFGNSGTSPATNFIGTTDNNSLLFKVNNQKAGYVGIEINDGNVFWGYQSGNYNTGYSNVGIGVKALFNNTGNSNLVAIGDFALLSNTTGVYNTAIGSKSLFANTEGNSNTANGYQALYSNTTGNGNTANGVQALFSNTTGYDNTADGYQALFSNTSGYHNTANGNLSLYSNTTGSDNIANGHFALYSNTTGVNNTASGFFALYSNTTGYSNTGYGGNALSGNTTGVSNTANGVQALLSNTTGSYNTAMGLNALVSNTTGSYNTALGLSADVSIGSLENATAIGFGAQVNASNKVRIGNSAVAVIEGQVPFSSPSDGRFKFNIRDDVSGLDFIMRLRPISYQFNVRRFDENLRSSSPGKENHNLIEASFNEASAIRRTGFIAQEVENAANESGFNFSGIIKPKSEKEYYSLSYESFVVPLVKGMQEQQLTMTAQNKKIEELEKKLAEMQKQMDELLKFVHK